jgi:integrase
MGSHDAHWLALVGKGSKAGKVALPPLARSALNRYLSQRRLPTTPVLWKPDTALIGALRHGRSTGITDTRLRSLMGRFFKQAAELVDADNPGLAHKLRRASPHWMRHTHATHALVEYILRERLSGWTCVDSTHSASVVKIHVYG